MISAQDIHAMLGADGWVRVLREAGIAEQFLRNKHGPCPACGGTDRYRFDNLGRGAFFCAQCDPGDGFQLLMRTQRLKFSDARALVIRLAGIEQSTQERRERPVATPEAPKVASPTARVRTLLRESCAVGDCEAAIDYLYNRGLWPLPAGHKLRAHPSVQYWHEHQSIGRYPALLAAVRDVAGELVTVHVTYLEPAGRKLSTHEPRKLLSNLTGHEGCAARIMGAAEALGIAEGVETALSAAKLTGVATWAALNAALLAKFEPPSTVKQLLIFADRDIAGLDAASKLMQRLQGRVQLEVRTPQAKDWNDTLRTSA